MSTKIPSSSDSPITNQGSPPCCNSTLLKISLVVLGLLLVGGAIASHIYQINTIAVYTMGSFGGFLILATAITSCMSRRSGVNAKIKDPSEFELKLQAYEEQRNWVELAKNGDVAAIQEALENKTLPEPTRLLHAAAFEGHANLVSILLANGADPKIIASYEMPSYSSLHLAAICRDDQKGLETMQVLLDKDPTLVSVKAVAFSRSDVTPLHFVAGGNLHEKMAIHKQKVELFIQNGADVNAVDSNGDTPLHEAAGGMSLGLADPNIEVIEILVRAGAQWNVKNCEGKTPLQIIQEKHSKWLNNSDIQSRLSVLTHFCP